MVCSWKRSVKGYVGKFEIEANLPQLAATPADLDPACLLRGEKRVMHDGNEEGRAVKK